MEQIIKEYGQAILEGLVVVLLIIWMSAGVEDTAGNKGLLAIIGANLTTTESNYENYSDFRTTYQSEGSKAVPTITYEGTAVSAGMIKLADYIKARDYAGNELPIRVISIKTESGQELIEAYNQDTSEIMLDLPGNYKIEVSAKDAGYRKVTCVIQIPVS